VSLQQTLFVCHGKEGSDEAIHLVGMVIRLRPSALRTVLELSRAVLPPGSNYLSPREESSLDRATCVAG
jgi:hypothetical protein